MKDVYILAGARTPFLKFVGRSNQFSAAELALACCKPLLLGQPFPAIAINEVIVGCVAPAANEANIARIIALRLGCGDKTPAWTVQRNCASGLQALDCAAKNIALGIHECVLAGGTEAMSHATLNYKMEASNWLADLKAAKTLRKKLKHFTKLRLGMLIPEVSLLKALKDPVVDLSMGETAEEVAYKFNITRDAMDQFALTSHLRASEAISQRKLQELVPLYAWDGKVIPADEGVRQDSSLEKLKKLKPVFDKPFGLVTAGNSSPISDGAAFLLLGTAEFAKQHNLKKLAKIRSCTWQALDPRLMGLGPVHAIAELLRQEQLKLSEIDFWEINEAFAGQVLGCTAALASQEYCQQHFGAEAFGAIDLAKLNVDGGAIALGHPVGASGARLVMHLAHVLQRHKAKLGIASLCIGGGQGGAMLIENVSEGQ